MPFELCRCALQNLNHQRHTARSGCTGASSLRARTIDLSDLNALIESETVNQLPHRIPLVFVQPQNGRGDAAAHQRRGIVQDSFKRAVLQEAGFSLVHDQTEESFRSFHSSSRRSPASLRVEGCVLFFVELRPEALQCQ